MARKQSRLTAHADLAQLSVEQLVERYGAEWGRAPRMRKRDWLIRQILRRVAEKRSGGLSRAARARLEELMNEIRIPATAAAPRPPDSLSIGSVLTRRWHGEEIQVVIVEGGIEWNGTVYGSLSAAAKAISGMHTSGRRFFGLSPTRRSR